MGREIRRVPPNWQHPLKKYARNSRDFQPMHRGCYEEAANEWLEECLQWVKGEHPDLLKHPEYKEEYKYYWDYAGEPPSKEYYVPYSQHEAVWYQVYETVSEGTPVTPAFETKEELINYLVEHGDFWDQLRFREGKLQKLGYSREAAEKFVMDDGWCPSFVVDNGVMKEGIESCI